ncbi:MAG: ABC transporter ATP-binding protein [Eubacteriales bacterium]|nr:ABC transporter ATP-binding protein [Eubacteriales bacterium]
MSLVVKDLHFSYGDHQVLNGVSFSLQKGSLVSLLGANGSGKSTLFSCILQFLTSYEGNIELDGINVADLSTKERAEKIAYIPQSHIPVFNFSCLEVVLMATQANGSFFHLPGEEDEKMAREMLKRVGLIGFEDRGYSRISGGERQLVLIARALAQGSKFLIMDEPTSSLDYGNQMRILSMIRELANDGYTIFLSTHHPDQALLFADEVILLHDGKIMAQGKAMEVLTSENLSTIYSLEIDVVPLVNGGMSTCIPNEVLRER